MPNMRVKVKNFGTNRKASAQGIHIDFAYEVSIPF
jgi:hypothetical protein